jgi:outer membrane protein assembly factor BamB
VTQLARLGLLGQCIAIALAPGAAERPSVPDASGAVYARAKAELHRAVEDGRIAGGAHLVVQDGNTLHSEAAGFGDIDERTPFAVDSILRIYSMTKPITSVAAMMLFEQGRFGLDDPVAQFIPAFTNTTVLETFDGKPRQVPPRRPITVRDVLSHTTGYSYGGEASVREFYEREGLRYQGPQGMFPPRMTIARTAEALARIPALHHPGEQFTYGFNTDLLGRLIEVWSGEPIDRYLQRAVFLPLEMIDTGFLVPEDKRARFTSCHTLSEGKLTVLDPAASSAYKDGFEFLSGGGGLVSTVRDYANFCQMLVDGGEFKERRLLKPETLRLMFTDQLGGVDGGRRFGLGFAIEDVTVGSGAEQRRVTCYGWGGYASTLFAVVPDERLFQIFALQQLPYTEELARQQFGIVYTGLTSPLIPSASRAATGSAHWPQFRGSGAGGVSVNTRLPDTWSATDNVAWKTDLPGRSWSSPIVWGERVFLTTVVNTGQSEEPRKGLYFGGERPEPSQSEHEWKVLCLDLATGKLEWEKTVHRGAPQTPIHLKSSYGVETPVTDGERVYALLGGVGVFAFTLDGREVWVRALEPRRMRHGWGTASSPVLHDGRLFIVNDNEEQAELIALDVLTGHELWRVDRDEKSNWATPFIWDNGLRAELVTPGSRAVRSYDLDGKPLWSFTGMSSIAIPTPVAGDDLLLVSSGYVGDKLRPLYAIRPGAEGDITLKAGETRGAFIAWSDPVGGPYNPSPLYYEGRVYVLYDRGLVSAYDAKTGRLLYDRERLPKGFAFTSSPWAANGRVFCLNEDGVCYVLRAGDTFELLHTNTLADDDMCLATPAAAGDRLLIRTAARLYCLRTSGLPLLPQP